ncbi:uncharacterized protein SAPINGB_P005214 [Magnusiomyces paraingens]|uniref:Uncharacterized protein n=1 Tax=Magnusiomyces paraingens TaxID=2606893 RepID=A0A5E8C642_9ASCO|nr:uncharacterized protein SAPINGB_P005214 [Saprochaete ingens]VVT56686.1 unnamed protein product [Saprochaete ingens]
MPYYPSYTNYNYSPPGGSASYAIIDSAAVDSMGAYPGNAGGAYYPSANSSATVSAGMLPGNASYSYAALPSSPGIGLASSSGNNGAMYMRGNGGGIAGANAAAAAAAAAAASAYMTPMSRPSSVSPTLGGGPSKLATGFRGYGGPMSVSMNGGNVSSSAAALWRDRFEKSRGFDVEDDLEFCPLACVSQHHMLSLHHHHPAGAAAAYMSPSSPEYYVAAAASYGANAGTGGGPSSPGGHSPPLGMYYGSSGNSSISSSSSSSSSSSAGSMSGSSGSNSSNSSSGGAGSPNGHHNTITYYNGGVLTSGPTPGAFGSSVGTGASSGAPTKVRKALPIIDPTTGLRVASPSLSPAGLAANRHHK